MQPHQTKETTSVVEQRAELAPYLHIFANSGDAIAILDPRGTYLEQNEAHRQLLGDSVEDLRGRTPAMHLGEDLFVKVHATLEREGTYRGEVIVRTREEQLKPTDLSCFTVRNEAGEAICHVWMMRDLSESK